MGNHHVVVAGQEVPNGYQQLTGLNTVKSLTVPANTRFVVLIAEGSAVRWRDDGTNPTSTVGMPLATGIAMTYIADPANLRFIEQTSGGVVNASYYR